jgi:hypothetical protein
MLESVSVLGLVYVIGGLAIVLFLLFMEQWNRAERLQKELDNRNRELQVAAEALSQVERQIDVLAAPGELETSVGQTRDETVCRLHQMKEPGSHRDKGRCSAIPRQRRGTLPSDRL